MVAPRAPASQVQAAWRGGVSHTRLELAVELGDRSIGMEEFQVGVSLGARAAQAPGLLDEVSHQLLSCPSPRVTWCRGRGGPVDVSVWGRRFRPRHGVVNGKQNLHAAVRRAAPISPAGHPEFVCWARIRRVLFIAPTYRESGEHVAAGDGRRPGRAPAERFHFLPPPQGGSAFPVPGRRPSPAGATPRSREVPAPGLTPLGYLGSSGTGSVVDGARVS